MLEDEAGDILAKARAGRGWSLERVARDSGLEPGALRAVERLERSPTAEEIAALAPCLGLDAAKLSAIARQQYRPRPQPEVQDGLLVRTLVVRQADGWTSNCYLVGRHRTEEAVVVDPGAEGRRILEELESMGWRPRYVALTHGHRDHVGGLDDLAAEWAVSVLASAEEARELGGWAARIHVVHDQEVLPLADHTFTAWLTPGHTAGSVCYQVDHAVFVGDTLFAGSLGRTNVTGAFEAQRKIVRSRLLSLPEETVLYPGHGPAATVGEERRSNPFF